MADANSKRNSQRVVSRRRPDKKTRKQANFVTSNSMHGQRMNIPADPPCIVQNPWTPITIHFLWRLGLDSQSGLINVADLTSKLRKQLDSNPAGGNQIFQNFMVYLRIHSVCVWNLTGKSVGLAVWDYSADSQDEDELGSWVDAGNSTGFPHIGYRWPLALRSNSLSNSSVNQARRICTIVSGSKEEVLVHARVEYRFITPTSNPLLGLNALSIIANNSTRIAASTKRASDSMSKIYDSMPGRTPTITGMASNVFVAGVLPIPANEVMVPEGRHDRALTIKDEIQRLQEEFNTLDIDCNTDGFSVPDSEEFNVQK